MTRLRTKIGIVSLLATTLLTHYALSAELQNSPEQSADVVPQQADSAIKILTLDQCIELALENNPGLQIEREKIIEFENDYRIASSGLYPRVTASAYYYKG